ncbi:MAG: L-histidine N(alpha)-methyltransferase [Acidobacteriota bacterium]
MPQPKALEPAPLEPAKAVSVRDTAPVTADMLADVLAGLSAIPKTLPSKYLYDETGSFLFEAICTLEAYYPTLTELSIMDRHVAEMAAALGRGCLLIEYGSGSGKKTEILLEALEDPAGYVPIEISRPHLEASARRLARHFPAIPILPVCADYTSALEIPTPPRPEEHRAVFFPGSTIGNFEPPAAEDFLRRIAEVCGAGGSLLIGVDLQKDPAILERAYNDPQGVTAAFNLNLLARLNRELGADFDLPRFRHFAIYNREHGRIEMHLESSSEQAVHLGGQRFSFAAGETICTEHSHKYTLDGFRAMARRTGFEVEQVWTDPKRWFSVQHLRA